MRTNEIEIQTAETCETLEKRDKDWEVLCAKFDEYKEKAKDRHEWKKKYDKLQIAFKELRHLLELYMAEVGRMSPEVLATLNSGGSKDAQSGNTTPQTPIWLLSSKNCLNKWPEQR